MDHTTRAKISLNTKLNMPTGKFNENPLAVNSDEYVLNFFTCNFYEQIVMGQDGVYQVRACKSIDDEQHWIEQEDNELHVLTVQVVKGNVESVKALVDEAFKQGDGKIEWFETKASTID